MKINDDTGLILAPPLERIKRFYDTGSPYYLEVFGQHLHDGYYLTGKESRTEAQENLIKFLVEKANIQPRAKILDVGCGMGGSSIWLAKNLGAKTIGITISPMQIEIARQLAREEKTDSVFLLMNAEEMDFPGSFDVIWLVAAVNHFRNQRNFFNLAAKYLEKRGKLILFDWMIDEGAGNIEDDRDIRLILEGMFLSSLHSKNNYFDWLKENGYRIIFVEDITEYTLKTWEEAISLIKEPGILKLAFEIAKKEGKGVFTFLKSIRAMKQAMRKGKMRSMIIIGEKI